MLGKYTRAESKMSETAAFVFLQSTNFFLTFFLDIGEFYIGNLCTRNPQFYVCINLESIENGCTSHYRVRGPLWFCVGRVVGTPERQAFPEFPRPRSYCTEQTKPKEAASFATLCLGRLFPVWATVVGWLHQMGHQRGQPLPLPRRVSHWEGRPQGDQLQRRTGLSLHKKCGSHEKNRKKSWFENLETGDEVPCQPREADLGPWAVTPLPQTTQQRCPHHAAPSAAPALLISLTYPLAKRKAQSRAVQAHHGDAQDGPPNPVPLSPAQVPISDKASSDYDGDVP